MRRSQGGSPTTMLAKLKGIHRVRRALANGETRFHYYAWRGGPSFWISAKPVVDPAPEEFVAAFEIARGSRLAPAATARDTVESLIRKFRAARFEQLSRSSRLGYEDGFEAIRKRFASAEIGFFEEKLMRGKVKDWHRSFAATPRAADMRLGTLVALMNFAVDEGLIAAHALGGIERLHEANRAHIIWDPGEIELFAKDAPFPLFLALHFLRLTGLRRGDALRIQLSADKGSHLEWTTSKTESFVVIPVVQELRAMLDIAARHRARKKVAATTILFNHLGRPWTPDGFSSSFDKRRDELGIEKRMHDLRGTAATGFMQAGLTDEEVADILGWKTADIAAIRKRYVARGAIVQAAIARLERNGG